MIIRLPDAPSLSMLAARPDAPHSLVSMIHGDDAATFADPNDRAAILVAAHTLCNHQVFQHSFLTAGGLVALCTVLRPALDQPALSSVDRITTNSGVFASAEKKASMHRTIPSSDSDSTLSIPTPEAPSQSLHSAPSSLFVDGGIARIVWNAAIRTIAKLMVVSPPACALSIDTGSLALLAKATKPGEPMDIRLRAAAGLAAIAAWSGPRRAIDIVQTDDVVLSMTAILSDQDERIPNDLRTATIDGLVVMSFRRHARGILQKHGCEDKIKAAARHATVSGDYATAARSTVAAGHLSGRSIDEYGFLVEDQGTEEKNDGFESAPESSTNPENAPLRKRVTGLKQLQQQLLEEPYTSVGESNVLEEIVLEDAGVLSSSPRDRNYVRRAARTYGVSADEIEFISVLGEESSPTKQEGSKPDSASGADKASNSRVVSSLHDSVDGPAHAVAPLISDRIDSLNRPGASLSEQTVHSSPRVSSQLFAMQDPDFDRVLQKDDDDETASTATAASSKSKIVSPLLMFSSATKKAAERDSKHIGLQKTNSQLTRETEHEQSWIDVMDKSPELLKRERGRSSRVQGYRRLALVPVPSSLRRRLWPILLDTGSLRESKPGLYGQLCRELDDVTMTDDIEHTIDADVTRTMPLHSLFWAGGAQVGVQSLRSILRAYAMHEPEVGYCQGMSSIAAVFLMNAVDEEEAFLMMVQFMSRFQYKKVFAPGFPLMLQWIEELRPLIAHYMPDLNAHLDREGVPLELYADKWLITALSHNFPHRHLLRVWDLMFLGGSPKIIMKACLTVLKKCEAQLMTMDFERMMSLLQRQFSEPERGVLDMKDPEPFINEMREFRFMPDIKKLNNGSPSVNKNTGRSNDAANNAKGRRKLRRERCLACFGRSRTTD